MYSISEIKYITLLLVWSTDLVVLFTIYITVTNAVRDLLGVGNHRLLMN